MTQIKEITIPFLLLVPSSVALQVGSQDEIAARRVPDAALVQQAQAGHPATAFKQDAILHGSSFVAMKAEESEKYQEGYENIIKSLHEACNEKEPAKVLEATKGFQNMIDAKYEGQTLIHRATAQGNVDLVKYLIHKGANVNMENDTKLETPLKIARDVGQYQVVPGVWSNNKEEQRFEIVKALLAKRAKDGTKEDYILLLQFGVRRGTLEDVKDVIGMAKDHGVLIKDHDGKDGIIDAKDGKDGKDGYTPLYRAVGAGKIRVAEYLIDEGADVNFKAPMSISSSMKAPMSISILKKAATGPNRSLEMVNVLLKKKANGAIKEDYCELLHEACDSKDKPLDVVQRILEIVKATEKGDDNEERMREFINRAFEGSLKVGKDYKDYKKQTPIYRAASVGNQAIVEYLIKQRANVNILGDTNMSPLKIAMENQHFDVVKVLLAAGAEGAEKQDYIKWLHHVCDKEKPVEAVQEVLELAENKASIQSKDIINEKLVGQTLIFRAAARGSQDLVEHLIKKGANVNLGDWRSSPLAIARKGKHFQIVKVLLKKGAKAETKEDYIQLLHNAKTVDGVQEVLDDVLQIGVNPAVIMNAKIDGQTPLLEDFFMFLKQILVTISKSCDKILQIETICFCF